jgi:mannosyltransferase
VSAAAPATSARTPPRCGARVLAERWPLIALLALAAGLRFATLDLQSFWYDEAFTPLHVLHASLLATLRSVVHTENTPPLWYLLAWADARVLGTGEVALRWPSALAGTITVAVAWAIGRQLTGRRATAIACAGLVAVNPLLVWYSQEARAYALFVLFAALSVLGFLRLRARPSARAGALFSCAGALALLSHYFAAFLLAPMVGVVVIDAFARARESEHPVARALSDPRALAGGAVTVVGLALVALVLAQGGHGTQWIGRWALSSRLQAVPQYYLTGYNGSALGHGLELAVTLPIIAGVGFGLWRVLGSREERAAAMMALLAAGGILLPIVLALAGADYLAPRNLVAAMIPVTALIAVIVVSVRAAAVGIALCALIALAFLAVSLDVDLSPRLQRGNWRALAKALATPIAASAGSARAITTVELGSAPLEYYLPRLRGLARAASLSVSEIDETGYAPLRAGASRPPAAGFRLAARIDVDGLIAYRFVASAPRSIAAATLRRQVITRAHPRVLVLAPAR